AGSRWGGPPACFARATGLAIQCGAAAAGIAAAVVGGHWLDWDGPAGRLIHTRRYTTSRGELREVMLDDGSTLTLDAGTSIWVALYQGRREVTVQHGQVMFAVSPDAGRPFDVLAGALRVTVVGTRFAVRQTETGLDAGRTVVAVESGRVRVEPLQRGFAGEATFLGAGERVSADAQGRLDEVVQVGAQSVAVWRQGRVSFNDTPLSQALAEFERYGPTGLALGDPAVGQLRLGGTFDLHAAQRFAQALPHLLPVRVQKTAHGIVIGSKR
ncbi:FecR family protein, partial [Bordetella holmesii]|uniref:FecR family protein n=1 Tax=Bordetella holmesii TaxID=35814 RepID=UPI0030FED6FD